jgi:hypothetical protein
VYDSENKDVVIDAQPKAIATGRSGQPKTNALTGSKMELHFTFPVSNIRNHIPIVFEMEKDQYDTWAELFRIHSHSHRVLHHIVPSKDKTPPTNTSSAEYEQWTTLDSTFLRWIYSTYNISYINLNKIIF